MGVRDDHVDYTFELWPILEHYGWDLPAPRTGWVTVKCHAHKDSHASCRVNNDLGAAKCQACDFGGDAIKIIQFYEGCGFRDAVRIAESLTGASGASRRGSGWTGRSVSSGPRDRSSDRAYVPPRLRH